MRPKWLEIARQSAAYERHAQHTLAYNNPLEHIIAYLSIL